MTICLQAIHFLGIPTTRAGTCITSESTVVRDIFYDGNPIHEKCSVVSRIAPTFLRYVQCQKVEKSLKVGNSVKNIEIR